MLIVGKPGITGTGILSVGRGVSVGGGGGAAWTPAQLSNKILWLRSSDGITLRSPTDDFVAAWADQFNENDAAQSTAGNQPAYNETDATANGLPSVQFDGSDDYLTVPADAAMDIDSGLELFVVLHSNSITTSAETILSRAAASVMANAAGSWALGIRPAAGDFPRLFIRNAADTDWHTVSWSTSIRDNNLHLINARYDGQIGGTASLDIDNSGTPATATIADRLVATSHLLIGRIDPTGLNPANVKLVECIWCAPELSTQNRVKVVEYFNARYGTEW